MKYKNLLFVVILLSYSLLYIATSYQVPCEEDCEKMDNFNTAIRNGRDGYVLWSYRCGPNPNTDTICVFVKDTLGVNWNLLADTACIIATQKGLLQQKILIIKNFSSPVDTLARKSCP